MKPIPRQHPALLIVSVEETATFSPCAAPLWQQRDGRRFPPLYHSSVVDGFSARLKFGADSAVCDISRIPTHRAARGRIVWIGQSIRAAADTSPQRHGLRKMHPCGIFTHQDNFARRRGDPSTIRIPEITMCSGGANSDNAPASEALCRRRRRVSGGTRSARQNDTSAAKPDSLRILTLRISIRKSVATI